jgi:gliding motility-associated-like protein
LKYFFFSILVFILFQVSLSAQTAFTVPDTVCAGEAFAPVNTSRTASSYFWHFCSANLNNSPSGVNLGNTGNLNGPAFIAIAEDSGQYYSFITNHVTRSITRNSFGNSLLNNPVSDSLGNFGLIPAHVEGIQVKKDIDGNWYGLIVGGLGGDEKLICLNFRNSLKNTPTIAGDYGNIGSMAYPVDFYLFKENTHWIGFTVNYDSNTITRFEFVNGLAKKPNALNLGNIGGLDHPCGICPFVENGVWYMLITNFDSHSVSRLKFGSSLMNTPTGTNMGSVTELDSPFDITLIRDCNQTFGFVGNRYSDNVVRLEFPQGITGSITYTNLGNIGNLFHPHGISEVNRVENEIFVFVANVDNHTLSRLYFSTCTEPTILTSAARNPPKFSYRHEGNYNISLILDQGLVTESFACKNIVVKEKPTVKLPNDTLVCPKTQLTFDAGSGYRSYKWKDGSNNQTYTTNKADTLWVEVTNEFNCKARDTLIIQNPPDNLFLGNDTSFTLGQSITLNAGNYKSYSWSTGETQSSITVIKPGVYAVMVTDANTCEFSDTIQITLIVDMPNFFTPNNDGYNDTWIPKIFYHYPEAQVKIFNRYGKLLASYRGSDPGWDGTYNGRPVEPDSYWYVVDLKNGIKPLTGSITIKR